MFAVTYLVQCVLGFVLADLKILYNEFKLETLLNFDIRYARTTALMSTVFDKPQLSTEELQVALLKGHRTSTYISVTHPFVRT